MRFFNTGLGYLSFAKIGRFWKRPLEIYYYADENTMCETIGETIGLEFDYKGKLPIFYCYDVWSLFVPDAYIIFSDPIPMFRSSQENNFPPFYPFSEAHFSTSTNFYFPSSSFEVGLPSVIAVFWLSFPISSFNSSLISSDKTPRLCWFGLLIMWWT